MKRPKTHQIDNEAKKEFLYACPKNWSVQNPSEDYGIDYYIRVFEENNEYEATNIFFEVQLKGVERYYDENEKYIKFRIKTDPLKFFLKVSNPVFLIIVNTTSKNIHWLLIQKYINESLNLKKPNWGNQKTVTLNIPKDNLFSNPKIIENYALEYNLYCSMLANGYPSFDLESKVKNIQNNLQEKNNSLKSKYCELYSEEVQLSYDFLNNENNSQESKESFLSVYNKTKNDQKYIVHHLNSIIGLLQFYEWSIEEDREQLFKYLSEGIKLSKKYNINYLEHFFIGSKIEKKCYIHQEELRHLFQQVTYGKQNNSILRLVNNNIEQIYDKLNRLYDEFEKNLGDTLNNNELEIFFELIQQLTRLNLHSIDTIYEFCNENFLEICLKQVEQMISLLSLSTKFISHPVFEYYLLHDKVLYYYYKQDEKWLKYVDKYIEFAKSNNNKNYLETAKSLKKELLESSIK